MLKSKESSLHRSLKFQYSGSNGTTETLVGDYVCDALTSDGEIIEVQTGSFGPLKEKVKNLTKNARLRIIHPIIIKKHIELYDAAGGFVHKRKSPRKGSRWDLFNALIYAPQLPLLKNLVIELVLIDVLEKRIDDGCGSWRRKGVRINDRFLAGFHETLILKGPKDYFQFLPFKKNENFTVKELSEKTGINTKLARKTIYVFGKMGLVEKYGKQGRAFIYRYAKKLPKEAL